VLLMSLNLVGNESMDRPRGTTVAKRQISKINKELQSIPGYKFTAKSHPEAIIEGVANLVTAGKRGLRVLQGKPKVDKLVNKKKKLQTLLKETEQLKNMAFFSGGKYYDYRGKEIINPEFKTITTKKPKQYKKDNRSK